MKTFRRPLLEPIRNKSGYVAQAQQMQRDIRDLQRAPVRIPPTQVIEPVKKPAPMAQPLSYLYMLVGGFYHDRDSLQFCDSDATERLNEPLAEPLVNMSAGLNGEGFIVGFNDFTVKVYDRMGVETLSFDSNADGGTFDAGAGSTVQVGATNTYYYVAAAGAVDTYVKRFDTEGVFVDELTLDYQPIIACKRDADEIWLAGDVVLTQYVDLVLGDDWTMAEDVDMDNDIDEDGFLYAMIFDTNEVWKIDLSDGSVIETYPLTEVPMEGFFEVALAVGGRDLPSGRTTSLLYVLYEGAAPGDGFIEVWDTDTASIISTVVQSGGTDNPRGIARQKVS